MKSKSVYEKLPKHSEKGSKMTNKVEIQLNYDAQALYQKEENWLPHYATEGSAGFDLRTPVEVVIRAGEVVKIDTGIKLSMQSRDMAAIVLPRSGLGVKGLILANTVGLIDSDYQGPITCAMWNRSSTLQKLSVGERFAQLVFIPVLKVNLVRVDEFSAVTERGEGGFGSTGQG